MDHIVHQELEREDGMHTFKVLIGQWRDRQISTEAEPETRI